MPHPSNDIIVSFVGLVNAHEKFRSILIHFAFNVSMFLPKLKAKVDEIPRVLLLSVDGDYLVTSL